MKFYFTFVTDNSGRLHLDEQASKATFNQEVLKCAFSSADESTQYVISVGISNFIKSALERFVNTCPAKGQEYGGYRQSVGFALAEVEAARLSLEALLLEIVETRTDLTQANQSGMALKSAERVLELAQSFFVRSAIDDVSAANVSSELAMQASEVLWFISQLISRDMSLGTTENIANRLGLC